MYVPCVFEDPLPNPLTCLPSECVWCESVSYHKLPERIIRNNLLVLLAVRRLHAHPWTNVAETLALEIEFHWLLYGEGNENDTNTVLSARDSGACRCAGRFPTCAGSRSRAGQARFYSGTGTYREGQKNRGNRMGRRGHFLLHSTQSQLANRSFDRAHKTF